MYAVIETGGKQYRVQSGDYLQIEKCEGDVGSALKFDQVLFIRQPDPEKAVFSLGKPYLPEASVEAEILGQGRGEKILIVKMKRRKQYRRTQGHRQYYTQVLITAIRPNQTEAGSSLNDAEKQTKRTQFQSHLKRVLKAHPSWGITCHEVLE